MTLSLPGKIPLTGSDCFLFALSHHLKNPGKSFHACRLVIDLDGFLSLDQLRFAVNKCEVLNWLNNLHWHRGFPWSAPQWIHNGIMREIPLEEHVRRIPEPGHIEFLPESILQREWPDHSPGLAFDLIRNPPGSSTVVMSWHHALMDARGADFLLHYLNTDSPEKTEVPGDFFVSQKRPIFHERIHHGLDLLHKIQFARKSLFHITRVSQPRIAFLSHTLSPQDGWENLFHVISFDEAQTREIDSRCEQLGAGFNKGLFCLGAVIHALHTVLTSRSQAPAAYVVPVPHDLRRRGCRGPVFSNHVTFLFFRVEHEEASSLKAIYSILLRQMKDQIAHCLPQSFETVMDMFRSIPFCVYSRLIKGPTKGRMASFFFSDAGDILSLRDHFLGAPVQGITHLPPALYPPGLTIIFTRFKKRLSATLSFIKGCMEEEDMDRLKESLRTALVSGDLE